MQSLQNHSHPLTPIHEKIIFHETGVKEVGDRCLTQHTVASPEY